MAKPRRNVRLSKTPGFGSVVEAKSALRDACRARLAQSFGCDWTPAIEKRLRAHLLASRAPRAKQARVLLDALRGTIAVADAAGLSEIFGVDVDELSTLAYRIAPFAPADGRRADSERTDIAHAFRSLHAIGVDRTPTVRELVCLHVVLDGETTVGADDAWWTRPNALAYAIESMTDSMKKARKRSRERVKKRLRERLRPYLEEMKRS